MDSSPINRRRHNHLCLNIQDSTGNLRGLVLEEEGSRGEVGGDSSSNIPTDRFKTKGKSRIKLLKSR